MTLLYLPSDQMGTGDPALGRMLLEQFLEQLAASGVHIDLVGCVNDGVRLTCTGSAVLDSLKSLQERGARIASCRTCLDHLDLMNSLQIGEVGSMDQTIKVLATADRVIRP